MTSDTGGNEIHVTCPHCGVALTRATKTAGFIDTPSAPAYPAPGDANLCFQCAGLSVYASGPFGVVLRFATPQESEDFHNVHGDYVAALAAFIRMRRLDPSVSDRDAFIAEILDALRIARARNDESEGEQ